MLMLSFLIHDAVMRQPLSYDKSGWGSVGVQLFQLVVASLRIW